MIQCYSLFYYTQLFTVCVVGRMLWCCTRFLPISVSCVIENLYKMIRKRSSWQLLSNGFVVMKVLEKILVYRVPVLARGRKYQWGKWIQELCVFNTVDQKFFAFYCRKNAQFAKRTFRKPTFRSCLSGKQYTLFKQDPKVLCF
jgi:hypothetical protein